MTREIKFRAWNKKEKKMYGPFTFESICQNGAMVFDDIEWMQFTGLKDKNGKEIYEGDIVELDCSSNKKHKWLATINWAEDYGQYDFRIFQGDLMQHQATGGHRCFDYAKIIGNIYENPGLLLK